MRFPLLRVFLIYNREVVLHFNLPFENHYDVIPEFLYDRNKVIFLTLYKWLSTTDETYYLIKQIQLYQKLERNSTTTGGMHLKFVHAQIGLNCLIFYAQFVNKVQLCVADAIVCIIVII